MIYDFDPLYSAYPKLINQTVKFLPMDTERRFYHFRECRDRRSILKTFGWLDTEINYSFNSYGFRSDEFEDVSIPSILFLGCSYTVGIGIKIEHSFTSIIAKELNLKNYNLGVGAGGADSSFRIGHYWIPKLKPTAVVFMNLFERRCEKIKKGNICEQIIINKQEDMLSDKHWDINNLKGLYALKHICHEYNIKFYNITKFAKLDLARDLVHPGKLSNEQTAEEILNQIKSRGK